MKLPSNLEGINTMVAKNKKIVSRGRGRPSLVGEKPFIEVINKSKSVDDVVKAFAVLRKMDREDAKLYVSIRAFNLRAKGKRVKKFQRGRKSSAVA